MSIFNSERLLERKEGKRILSNLRNHYTRTLIIHYSCESFFNLHGRTPRIVTICVKNRANCSTKTFSIHLEAQNLKMDLCCLSDAEFDVVERNMLKEFYKYLKKYKSWYWVHWNMRNADYGFEAIYNRFRILGGKPIEIEDPLKFDLPNILGKVYTSKFAKHDTKGQLLRLTVINRITDKNALPGKLEADAFGERNYLSLQMSTSRKVEIIDRILILAEKGSLKVDVSSVKSCGLTPTGIIEIVQNNWLLFLIYSVIIAVIGAILEPLFQHWAGTDIAGK